MNADILRITDPIVSDESISEYEHLEYNPFAGTNLNDGGDITITIELQFYPPERKLPSYRRGTVKE